MMNPKYKSRRFWITIWAIALSTTLMLTSMFGEFDPSWLSSALPLLLSIILAYVGIESYGRTKQSQKHE